MASMRHRLRSLSFRRRSAATYVSTESPKLQSDELFAFDMNSGAINGSPPDPITPTPQSANSSEAAPAPEPINDHDSPIRQTSPNIDHSGPPPPSDREDSILLSPIISNADTSASESQAQQWSAAVGRATTGKSGRVIERLMGENDRLRRELKHQSLRCEEEVKRSEMAKAKSESLQVTNGNLVAMREVDVSALARRERKVEELKADLGAERNRRERAERETTETTQERDEVVGTCRRELAAAKETARKATTQYEVLSSSWKGLTDGYRRQLDRLRTDIRNLVDARNQDRMKLERLEVVMEQSRQEGEKIRKAKEATSKKYADYKAETEDGIKGMRERAERNEQAIQGALEETERVLGEMRYVINIKKDVKESS